MHVEIGIRAGRSQAAAVDNLKPHVELVLIELLTRVKNRRCPYGSGQLVVSIALAHPRGFTR
jgi:hypothetical protein